MITIQDLAQTVIEVLDLQKKYFKGREQADLIKSKQLEKILRTKAELVLKENANG